MLRGGRPLCSPGRSARSCRPGRRRRCLERKPERQEGVGEVRQRAVHGALDLPMTRASVSATRKPFVAVSSEGERTRSNLFPVSNEIPVYGKGCVRVGRVPQASPSWRTWRAEAERNRSQRSELRPGSATPLRPRRPEPGDQPGPRGEGARLGDEEADADQPGSPLEVLSSIRSTARRRASGATPGRTIRAGSAEQEPAQHRLVRREREASRVATQSRRRAASRRGRGGRAAGSRCRADDATHHAPGFQTIRTRITRTPTPLPELSASVIGSRPRTSSGLGASPSAASRSASFRVSLLASAAVPPCACEDPEDDREDHPCVAVAVADVVHEPEPEHERDDQAAADRHHGDARQPDEDGDLARPLAPERGDVEAPGGHRAAEEQERAMTCRKRSQSYLFTALR